MSIDQRANAFASDGTLPLRRRILHKIVSHFLPVVERGCLTLSLPSGDSLTCGLSGSKPSAEVKVQHWRALLRLAFQGDAGFAEAFEKGEVSADNLPNLFDFALSNKSVLDHGVSPSKLGLLLSRLTHWLNRNSRGGSRRNISSHYDLGNGFYRAWLDEGMQYSSALYTAKGMTLEQAQREKLKRILELLHPRPGDTVLEIGCGWGALMEELVCQHDCSVTGITLSHEQASYAQHRLATEIAAGKAAVSLMDYRDCKERYNRIVSVEMIEAVGEAYWPTYFAKLRNCLAEDGVALIQAISIAEDRFEHYRNEPDFIQQRIFPGGMLPTVSAIQKHAAEAGLQIAHQEFFGQSYAETLTEWRRRFNAAWHAIQPMGFDEGFHRLWNYYLAYCEAGFRHKVTNVGLYALIPVQR